MRSAVRNTGIGRVLVWQSLLLVWRVWRGCDDTTGEPTKSSWLLPCDANTRAIAGVCIGEGTVCLCACHVCPALVEACWGDEVFWSGLQVRQEVRDRRLRSSNSVSPCRVCRWHTDSTPRNSKTRARIPTSPATGRKQRYDFQSTIIADDLRRIVCFNLQWPGSVNDTSG